MCKRSRYALIILALLLIAFANVSFAKEKSIIGGNSSGGGSVIVATCSSCPTGEVCKTINGTLCAKSATLTDPLSGVFIPRHETAANMDVLLLQPGEIATTSDTGEFRVGDGTTAGGKKYFNPQDYVARAGVMWTNNVVPALMTASIRAITYGEGYFVGVSSAAATRLIYSADLKNFTWSSQLNTSAWYGIAYGNGIFVAVAQSGTNQVATSPDGITWTMTNTIPARLWESVVFGNGIFLAVSSSGGYMATSTDGVTWAETSNTVYIGQTYGNILYSPATRLFYTRGLNTDEYHTSPDGITWTLRNIGISGFQASKFAYGNGLHMVTDTATNRIAVSKDGLTGWIAISVPTVPGAPTYTPPLAAWYANGYFFIVQATRIYRSTDSTCANWVLAHNAPYQSNYNAFAYGKGMTTITCGFGGFAAGIPVSGTMIE